LTNRVCCLIPDVPYYGILKLKTDLFFLFLTYYQLLPAGKEINDSDAND